MKISNLKILFLEIAAYVAAFGITDYFMDKYNIQPLRFYLPLFIGSIFLLHLSNSK